MILQLFFYTLQPIDIMGLLRFFFEEGCYVELVLIFEEKRRVHTDGFVHKSNATVSGDFCWEI